MTFPGEETDGIEARFESTSSGTKLRVESVESDGSPRDLYQTMAVVVGPEATSFEVQLDQTGPGVYEADLGALDSGAYAVRVTQTRPGTAALGRTIGLVEPVASEYRLLGVNQALLATIRAATGGAAVTLPAEPWIHDLKVTTSFTELWPWLLLLALLLFPLDIALRRVSLGRRELVEGRAWVVRRWRSRGAAAPRTAAAEGLLAARGRAGGASSRAAMLRVDTDDTLPTETPVAGPAPAAVEPEPEAAPEPKPAANAGDAADTIARLREAKRRAKGQ